MKRETVTPNLPVLLPLIKKKCRSNVVFTKEIRGKDKSGWVTEWSRGSNYPSPEEAARMCVLLQTTPEEILTEQADIELVRRLLEQEREKSIKKAPGHEAGGVSDKDLLIEAIQKIGDSDTALAVLDALNKRMQELR